MLCRYGRQYSSGTLRWSNRRSLIFRQHSRVAERNSLWLNSFFSAIPGSCGGSNCFPSCSRWGPNFHRRLSCRRMFHSPFLSPSRCPHPSHLAPVCFALLGHLLYNHNPFYLISAFLTLYGIHAVFGVEVVGQLKTASVLLAIGAYTAVLGLTGVLIVRFGKVWEDARTVLLAVILLLLATSVCTDELLMLSPDAALLMIVGGLSFAIALCEFIIRGLQIRFGAEFRIPLFLQLSILFLYPYFCAAEVHGLTAEQVQWRVLGFPLAFSLGLATLWPAVLRVPPDCATTELPGTGRSTRGVCSS